MNKLELQIFADNYTMKDFDKIKFDWNGQHGDKFQDGNYNFRMEVCEFIVPNLDKVKLELIRDLYLELAKCSKEIWIIYNKFHLFAQQLLARGGTNYLMDYMQGASLSFDAHIASGSIEINRDIAKQCLNYILKRTRTPENEAEKRLCEAFIKRFEWLSNK
jgi:hypothetical protein